MVLRVLLAILGCALGASASLGAEPEAKPRADAGTAKKIASLKHASSTISDEDYHLFLLPPLPRRVGDLICPPIGVLSDPLVDDRATEFVHVLVEVKRHKSRPGCTLRTGPMACGSRGYPPRGCPCSASGYQKYQVRRRASWLFHDFIPRPGTQCRHDRARRRVRQEPHRPVAVQEVGPAAVQTPEVVPVARVVGSPWAVERTRARVGVDDEWRLKVVHRPGRAGEDLSSPSRLVPLTGLCGVRRRTLGNVNRIRSSVSDVRQADYLMPVKPATRSLLLRQDVGSKARTGHSDVRRQRHRPTGGSREWPRETLVGWANECGDGGRVARVRRIEVRQSLGPTSGRSLVVQGLLLKIRQNIGHPRQNLVRRGRADGGGVHAKAAVRKTPARGVVVVKADTQLPQTILASRTTGGVPGRLHRWQC
ncbi:hypothetical protein FRUB_01459 [Fimbriiglobus ruber]|uniref:Uncharacterized protein n=1 Tax=Fimbriiglobus ruber TaxID=1908690 RepID=A0A225E2W1_9BACT|nr:hypothetical protein FRUB_01459 [Fimbriiglobus ruber]